MRLDFSLNSVWIGLNTKGDLVLSPSSQSPLRGKNIKSISSSEGGGGFLSDIILYYIVDPLLLKAGNLFFPMKSLCLYRLCSHII